MGPGHGGDPQDESAKHALDRIGAEVQTIAHKAADKYKDQLKGYLSKAKFLGVSRVPPDPCELLYQYHTNVKNSGEKEYPCKSRSNVRFSDTEGAQCDDRKIRGSDKTSNGGACAPYRRLHVCDYNLENINDYKNINNHTLLVDVCLSAKHEGESLRNNHAIYKTKYPGSQLCTMLARSFADIGDIVRGKDLYLGDQQEKEKLENNLKEIFKKIYDNLNDIEAKTYYNSDTPDFYKLREDWWNTNRQEVWKAITCDVVGSEYFGRACSGGTSTRHGKCQCIDETVPTNFDYIPQYLRWFEEWSEEFCRKKKKKFENVKRFCRDESNDLYCSLNGYDCKGTIRAEEQYSMTKECTRCLFACSNYIKWIDKQKDEFNKQKNKYQEDLKMYEQSNGFQKKFNTKYYNEFYDRLRSTYNNVEKFLEMLNKDKECKNKVEREENKIDFKEKTEETFSHTKYCEPCPYCGGKFVDGVFKSQGKEEGDCPHLFNSYEPPDGVDPTEINVLYTDEDEKDIMIKLEDFCEPLGIRNNIKKEKWKCYYKDSNNNKCVLQPDRDLGIDKKVKDYVDFMMSWINHMLKDSIDWRKYITRCINNTTSNKCKNGCKNNCECFKKWITEKQNEWAQIKTHFKKQTDIKIDPYIALEFFLEDQFFTDIKVAYGNEEAIDRIKKLKEDHASRPGEDPSTAKYVIDILLEHEFKEADECLENVTKNQCPDEDERRVKNPCRGKDGGGKITSVNKIAKKLQWDAKVQMKENSRGVGGAGPIKLKADASKGTYKKNRKPSDLKENICNINTTHSNDSRSYGEPCKGKDGSNKRFDIGTLWKTGNPIYMNDEYSYMPPRRQHMCTSNLENLDDNHVINNPNGGSPGDSLLGDVLLAANRQAERIKNDFFSKKYDNAAACRALRYSFADLGDIIRGRDLWEKENGMQKLRGHIEKIFGIIHKSIKEKGNHKYNDDDQKSPPYKKLREDWWSANRSQVWKAVKCALKDISCDDHRGTTPPYDDYIPQRLRWMTEWAEWYCKVQKEAYEELEGKCSQCKAKDRHCTRDDVDYCNKCKEGCEAYKTKIYTWEQQWNNMQVPYITLYLQAKKLHAGTVLLDASPDYQQVVDFLSKLHTQNNGKSTYESAAAYVHDTGNLDDCQKQDHFCEYKGGTPNGTKNEKYAFRSKPYDHDIPCSCHERNKNDELCKEVKGLLEGKDGETTINGCNKKEDKDWTCNDADVETTNTGACMPPRRQSLCLHDLTVESDTKDKDKLKDPFIRCVAKEIHFLWHKYKRHKKIQDEKLKNGTIPEDFRRIMYYTFGDYRDILFDTDISAKSKHILKVQRNINNVFGNNKNGKERQEWWEKNKNDIWQGMLCALPHSDELKKKEEYKTPPEEFVSRPQFLRWFIEWSDEFCAQREEKEAKVKVSCKTDYEGCDKGTNNVGSSSCVSACKEYKKYITDKKTQYDKQKGKFEVEKKKKEQGYDNYFEKEPSEYLKDECFTGTCSCMKKLKDNSDYWENYKKTYDNTTLQNRCECERPPPDACTIVKDLFEDNSEKKKYFDQACSLKYSHGKEKNIHWKCQTDTTPSKPSDVTPLPTTTSPSPTSTCIPPRRQKLYLKKIEELTSGGTPHELRKAFIESAAVETFFLWHKYKKDKEIEDEEQQELFGYKSRVEENLQKDLEEGKIDDEFKRQMFYTFGDYRDILFGKNIDSDVETVKKNINKVFENGKSKTSSAKTTPKDWWNKNGEYIWKGMLCALSYDTEKTTKNEKVHNNLIKDINKNSQYDYNKVKIKSIPISGDNNTTLMQFASRPPFFRYLEEWGEEFCRKRTYTLKRIKEECRGKYNGKYCDGDGFDCKEIFSNKKGNISTFSCPTCGKYCRSYKQWINRKKKEFHKQNEKYDKEIKNVKTNNYDIYDKQFFETLPKNYKTIDLFLAKLKEEPYCKDNTGDSIINFKKSDETFRHAKLCTPCPVFGVQEKKDGWSNVPSKTCHGETFKDTDNIKTMKNPIEKGDMLVIDNNTKGFAGDLQVCQNSSIFKGIRNDQWNCKYLCDIDVCFLENFNEGTDDKQNIQIRTLFKRWIENFLKDYNKIKENLNPCMNNGKESKCINGCSKNCECVEKWIDQKKEEWEKVRELYLKPYGMDHSDNVYEVKRFLKDLKPQTEVEKAIKTFGNLDDLDKSTECSDPDTSEREKGKEKDVVECLLNKLKKELKSCKTQHGDPQKPCEETLPPNTLTDEILDEDKDTPTNTKPQFCPQLPKPPQPPEEVPKVEPVRKKDKEEPPEKQIPINCIDKAAYELQKEATNKIGNVSNSLKSKGNENDISLTDCTKVDTITFFNDNIGTTTINEKEMYKVFPRNNDSCDNKSSNRFNSEKQWLCNNINHKKKNICLPPRRRYMCLRKIERMITKDVDDKDKFFQVVMKAAKEEGIRILKNYKEQNKTDFSEICDDMKYSFADLGDIIRGKDLWNTDKNYKNIQDKIRYVFDYMHKKLNSDDQKRYKDLVNHYDLRSDWWEANRKDIWKAMTCAAPRNAYIYKTTENSETKIRSTDMYYYCGYGKEPPYVDYIPQKLRWMTEWSEYFCKELNRKLEQMKTNCDSCKLNDSNCRDSNDGNNCRKCQQNCQEYTKLVNQGKKQFILQDNQYKEIYKKISNNSDGKAYVGTHVVEFFKKVKKNNCSDLNSADKYLYKGSNCKNLTFTENDNEHRTRTYAFTEKPIEYKNKCTCEITNNPLDKCPTPQNRIICNNLKLINSYRKNYTFNLKDWNSNLVPKNSSDNFGVLVPPRRKHLCLNNITALFLGKEIKNKENLRNVLLNSAFNEAYFLWSINNKDSTRGFEAIKYSFADYGDIIKGTDIMESSLSDKIGKIFTNTLDTNARSKWWNENKQQVWHAMLCGYRRANDRFVIDADTCKLPKEDEIPQFLRWLIEWAKQACKEYSIRKSAFKDFCHCSNSDELSELDLLKDNSCNYELTKYLEWNTMVKQYMDGFNIKFQKVKKASVDSSISENSVQEYLKNKIEGNQCDFNDIKNIHDKIGNPQNKKLQEIFKILCPNKKIEKDKSEEIDDETSSKPREEDTSHVEPPPLPPIPPLPPPADQPFDPTILQTTIPFGVALALGSIAFLFLKKKTQSPVDLLRVLDIHKGEYGMPTKLSTNRYIPYRSDRYKGKTYIYMEGDSDEDKYAFMSDTTDVTSSESEYEELDINDIYVPHAPKYKTLIEVVLEPSGNNTTASGNNTPSDTQNDIQNDGIPSSKFSDNEWNTLKDEFISQYIQSEQPKDVPNDYT
ncbi:hypothetical protein PFMALIP_05765, partial [Plasmodium falciparum MaliPS096_E11]